MQLVKKLKSQATKLKAEVHVLLLAYADNRTPWIAKILVGLTVGYLLSPIDLIPDFIPILGILDDLIIVPFLIRLSIKLIPQVVMTAAREFVNENPKKMKKGNWIFAGVIIIVWLTLFYWAYSHFNYLWKNK